MSYKNYLLAFFFSLILLSSCEKEVKVDLKTSAPQLVVQGTIENGQPPYVILTKTIGFFSNVDLSTIQGIFVHGAVVTVSNGTKTCTLREYTIDTAGGNKFSVYSIDTANLASAIIGEIEEQYTLSITVDGKTFKANTKIPNPKGLDTLWFGEPVFSRKNTPKNALELFGNYTDPDTAGNYVKYYTKRNDEPYYSGQLFTDELVNGKKINNIDLYAGYDNTANAEVDSVVYFYPGDTIILKWCEIDKGVYDFWNTFQFAIRSGGNPFSSPINVKTNISNGALGLWAGYGTIYSNLVAR